MQNDPLDPLLAVLAARSYSFVPPTPATQARIRARRPDRSEDPVRDLFGWSRAVELESLPPEIAQAASAFLRHRPDGLLESTIRVASLDDALYAHSAYPTVAQDAVFFGPDTYRFVRAARQHVPHQRFARAIDLGCGTGVGGLALTASHEIEQLALVDINPTALRFAAAHARRQRPNACLVASDLAQAIEGDFDLVLANPPFIADEGERRYRDGGGALGMGLARRIVSEMLPRLRPGGVLFLYLGSPIRDGIDAFADWAKQTAKERVCTLMRDEIDPDIFGEELENPPYAAAGIERIAAIALTFRRTL